MDTTIPGEISTWVEALLLFVVLLLVMVLSATSSRVLSMLGVPRAKYLVDEGYKKLEPFVAAPNGYMLTISLLNMLSTVGVFWLGHWLLSMPVLHLQNWMIWLILGGVFFVFHTLLAMAFTRGDDRRTAARIVMVLRPFYWCMKPLTALLELLFKPIMPRYDAKFADAERIEEELEVMLDESTRQGGLEDIKGRIMRSAIDYSETTVREVMIPRTELTACPVDETLDKALELFVSEGYSRLPVYEGNIDTIVGILYFKDIVQKFYELRNNDDIRDKMTIKALVREAFFVPETNHIDDMFEDFKREHIHMAIVVDEFGGTAGVITLEDIVEEFFGEIQDEYDSEDAPIVPLDKENHRVLVDARTNISELGELFDVDLDESAEYESVGGLVNYKLGRLGTVGDEMDESGLHFVVRQANERCITQVEVSKTDMSANSDHKE